MRVCSKCLSVALGMAMLVGFPGLLRADLVGYWNFDGNANDQSGGGNDGTLVGAPGFMADFPAQIGGGQSLDITANGQGVRISSPPPSFNATNFTLSYWLKNPGQSGAANRLTSRSGNQFETGVANAAGSIGGVGDGLIVYSATNPSWRSAGVAPDLNEWTHVAYVYDGSTLTTYANGSPYSSQALGISPSGDLAIGMTAAGTESFIGRIDDVALWDQRLPRAAIRQLAAGSATPLTVSTDVQVKEPVGYWTFDGYTHDQSGNGYHGMNLLNVSYSGDTPFGFRSGQSLVLGGSTRVDIAADPALDSRVFTLAYWFNQGGAVQNGTYERATSRGSDTFETAVSGDGSLSFYSRGGPGWQDTGYDLAPSGWQHVAVVSNGTTVDTYVDGVRVFTGAIGNDPAGILRIGARANVWTEGIEGRIDDVALWDEALSPEQIAALAGQASRPGEVISITSDPSQWLLSTERQSGGPLGTWSPVGDPLPDVSTFTEPAQPTTIAGVLAAASDLGLGTLLGDGGNGQPTGVQFYRTTFNLDPSGDVGANIVLAVDNGASIFINGTEVARETSFLTENWARPYSTLSINGDGSISDVTLFDWVAPSFSDWRSGQNELVLAIRNPDPEALGAGGLAFRMDVNGAGAPPPPELPSMTVTSDPALWMLSTVRTSGGPAGTWTPSGDPLPDASTFTEPAQSSGVAGIVSAASDLGVETLLGDGGNGLPEGVQYYRTTFDLERFAEISAELILAADNGAQVFINGEEIARETSFLVENWSRPYSSLTINPDGSITDVTLFDQVAASFTGWRAGENEIIIALRNPDTEALAAGGLAFRLDITTAVPEPSAWCLMVLGGLGLMWYRQRRRDTVA